MYCRRRDLQTGGKQKTMGPEEKAYKIMPARREYTKMKKRKIRRSENKSMKNVY